MTLFLTISRCVYCGNTSNCRDHFIPISQELPTDTNFELPACYRCNGAASNKRFTSLLEKVSYVRLHTSAPLNPIAIQTIDELLLSPPQRRLRTCHTCGNPIPKRRKRFCSQRCYSYNANDSARRNTTNSNRITYREAIDHYLSTKNN